MYLAHNSNYLGKLFKGLTYVRRSVSLVSYFVEALNQTFNQTE